MSEIIKTSVTVIAFFAALYLIFQKRIKEYLVVQTLTELSKPGVWNRFFVDAMNNPESWFNRSKK